VLESSGEGQRSDTGEHLARMRLIACTSDRNLHL
jgi:hypothetical protein